MSAAFAEIAIGFARNSRLSFSDGLNNNLSFLDQLVESPAGDGIAASVDDKCGFNKIGGG